MKTTKASPPKTEAGQPSENFERLAKKLMAVPKKELDEKIAEYERDKESRKRKKKT